MPRKDVFVVIAPTTELLDYGSCVLDRIIKQSVSPKQRVFIAYGDAARADVAREVIKYRDPAAVFGVGHGSKCTFTVQAREPFLSACPPMNTDIIKGRVWYLNSCEVGAELGKKMVKDYGATAFIGHNKPFLFPIVTPPCMSQEVMAPFLAEYVVVDMLVRGYTVGEAHKARIAEYDKLIDYYTFGPGNASVFSDLVVRLLEIDQMIAVAYGDMKAVVAAEKRPRKRDLSWIVPFALLGGITAAKQIFSA